MLGSTVATSLCKGESLPKHAFILKVCKDKFSLHSKPLTCVRQFVFDQIVIPTDLEDSPVEFVTDKLQNMLKEVTPAVDETLKLPLVRLNITVANRKKEFNSLKIQQEFSKRIQNFTNCIKFSLPRSTTTRSHMPNSDDNSAEEKFETIFDFLQKFYKNNHTQYETKFIPFTLFNKSCKDLVDRNDFESFESLIEAEKKQCFEVIKSKFLNRDKNSEEANRRDFIDNCLSRYVRSRVDDENATNSHIESGLTFCISHKNTLISR